VGIVVLEHPMIPVSEASLQITQPSLCYIEEGPPFDQR